MLHAYTAEQIRAAERPLLDAQREPDELMKSAAHAVFLAAETMLTWPDFLEHYRENPRILLLVGKGGNGGDALYAGAELALAGHTVDAWLAWGSAHEPALEAFRNAGGTVLDSAPMQEQNYRLAIDGLETQRADQAQVNVDHVLDVGRVEVDEQVLAVGGGAGET